MTEAVRGGRADRSCDRGYGRLWCVMTSRYFRPDGRQVGALAGDRYRHCADISAPTGRQKKSFHAKIARDSLAADRAAVRLRGRFVPRVSILRIETRGGGARMR